MNNHSERSGVTVSSLASDEKRMRQPQKSNAYHYQPARLAAALVRKPQPQQREVVDLIEVWNLIEAFIFDQDQVRFVPSPRAHKVTAGLQPQGGTGSVGFLLRYFKLSELRRILGRPDRSEGQDEDVLSVLDKLSLAFKLKIISAEISKWGHFSDCSFCAECGTAIEEIRSGWTLPKLYEIHFYRDEPLDQRNFLWGDRTVLMPSERVAKLRERRDSFFRREFGWSNFIESRLHREDVEDEARLKAAILKLAEAKDQKTDEGNQNE